MQTGIKTETDQEKDLLEKYRKLTESKKTLVDITLKAVVFSQEETFKEASKSTNA